MHEAFFQLSYGTQNVLASIATFILIGLLEGLIWVTIEAPKRRNFKRVFGRRYNRWDPILDDYVVDQISTLRRMYISSRNSINPLYKKRVEREYREARSIARTFGYSVGPRIRRRYTQQITSLQTVSSLAS